MTTSTFAYPKVVSRDEWLAARKKLLAKEKELTRHRDALNAERRRLPMVEIAARKKLLANHLPASPGSPTTRAARAARSWSTTSATSRTCTRATLLSSSFPAHHWPRSGLSRREWAGPSRGILRSGATSTTTSTPRRTKPSLRSSTTTRTRQRSSGRTRPTICVIRLFLHLSAFTQTRGKPALMRLGACSWAFRQRKTEKPRK
jgi:hypothetical protein